MINSLTTDERIGKVDAQFSEMNKKLDRLAIVIEQGFDRIEKKLESKANKTDVQRVYDYLDKIIKLQESIYDECLVMGHQLDRLDYWVHEVADKIGYTHCIEKVPSVSYLSRIVSFDIVRQINMTVPLLLEYQWYSGQLLQNVSCEFPYHQLLPIKYLAQVQEAVSAMH